jgi:hypothetical protein
MNFATSVTDPDPRIRTLDYGSGSSYGLAPDPDPAIFVSDFQDANKKFFYPLHIFCITFCRCTFTSAIKDNKSSNNRKFNIFFFFGQFLRSVLDSLRIR